MLECQELVIDPEAFANALEARGCTITNIVKNDDNYWFYDINSDNAYLGAKKVESGVTTPLGKPLKPYWIDVKNLKEITVTVHSGDHSSLSKPLYTGLYSYKLFVHCYLQTLVDLLMRYVCQITLLKLVKQSVQ